MLPCQRDAFDMPRDIAYLNAAAWTPLPRVSQEAGHVGVGRKGQPWKIAPDFPSAMHERTRRAAAALINADAEDVAIISSVSYGVASAAKSLAIPRGSRVLVLAEDHSSPVLEWTTRAAGHGFTVETIPQPADGDWTEAVLAAIARPGAPVGLASIASVHWSDGGAIDLARVGAALRAQGAALLVDATHGAGVMELDVKAFDPDFLIFPTYKWVLGPYGRAFLYIAKRHQDGIPLEQTGFGRRAVSADATPYMRDTAYVTGARRFDMGERDHFISMEMAAIGMEMVAQWGAAAITARLRMLTDRLAEGLGNSGALIPDARVRAPHILSLGFPKGMPDRLLERLEAQGAYAAPRLGRLRISPHVYNDEQDVDRFVAAFHNVMST